MATSPGSMTMTNEKWQQTNKNSTQVDENRTEVGGARRATLVEGEEAGETRQTGQATEKEAKAVKWEHEHENVKLPGGIMRVQEAEEAAVGGEKRKCKNWQQKKREKEREREKKTRTN